MINNTRKWLLYSVYILAVTIFFVYYLFPSDMVKSYITSNFNQINPDIKITIDHVGLALPIGLKLSKVNVYHLDDTLLETDQVKVVPDLWSLFRSKVVFFFKGKVFEGILKGSGEFIKNRPGQNVILEGDLSGINVQKISAVKQLVGRSLTGILKGNFTFHNGSRSGGTLGAKFIISDGELELLTPIFDQGNMSFSKIEAEMTVENQRLKLKRCIITANALDGNVSGLINLKEPLGQSYLRLLGVIKPNQEFLTKLGKDLPANLLPQNLFNKKVIRIRVYGTLDDPRFFVN